MPTWRSASRQSADADDLDRPERRRELPERTNRELPVVDAVVDHEDADAHARPGPPPLSTLRARSLERGAHPPASPGVNRVTLRPSALKPRALAASLPAAWRLPRLSRHRDRHPAVPPTESGAVAQLGEHHVRNVGVEGSNPFCSIYLISSPCAWALRAQCSDGRQRPKSIRPPPPFRPRALGRSAPNAPMDVGGRSQFGRLPRFRPRALGPSAPNAPMDVSGRSQFGRLPPNRKTAGLRSDAAWRCPNGVQCAHPPRGNSKRPRSNMDELRLRA